MQFNSSFVALALDAAKDAARSNDVDSAFEYMAIAVAEMRKSEKLVPGNTLLILTPDAQECVEKRVIDLFGCCEETPTPR